MAGLKLIKISSGCSRISNHWSGRLNTATNRTDGKWGWAMLITDI